MNLERRRIEKIFTQINKIGSKGRDNELEYKYVDDIVAKGDYDNLLQCLYYYYDIDTKNKTVEDVKSLEDIILDLKVHLKQNLRSYIFLKVYIKHHLIYSRMILFLGQLKS
jgi:hypothetical protein